MNFSCPDKTFPDPATNFPDRMADPFYFSSSTTTFPSFGFGSMLLNFCSSIQRRWLLPFPPSKDFSLCIDELVNIATKNRSCCKKFYFFKGENYEEENISYLQLTPNVVLWQKPLRVLPIPQPNSNQYVSPQKHEANNATTQELKSWKYETQSIATFQLDKWKEYLVSIYD